MEAQIQDKGRITLPRKIRKALGINEKDWVMIEVQGNKIVMKPKNSITVAQTFGIVKSKKRIKLEDIEEAAGKNALS
ncbi:MAG: AbrB/MazE/SpoVT family DNA-binding domain-containing protein [Nitrososphaerales archaeon]